jgi:hypothetical protein
VNGWLVPRDDDLGLSAEGLWQWYGSYWRDHRLYTIFGSLLRTEVTCENRRTGIPFWAVHLDQSILREKCPNGSEDMASRYIAAAIKVAEKRTDVCTTSDDVLFKGRPALREFMTSLEGAKDVPRDLSVLMIACSEMGLRVGLKDDQAGGWVWRESTDLAGALDAVEKALVSGNAVFTAPGGRRGRRR